MWKNRSFRSSRKKRLYQLLYLSGLINQILYTWNLIRTSPSVLYIFRPTASQFTIWWSHTITKCHKMLLYASLNLICELRVPINNTLNINLSNLWFIFFFFCLKFALMLPNITHHMLSICTHARSLDVVKSDHCHEGHQDFKDPCYAVAEIFFNGVAK